VPSPLVIPVQVFAANYMRISTKADRLLSNIDWLLAFDPAGQKLR
jgi:hypothetical protein